MGLIIPVSEVIRSRQSLLVYLEEKCLRLPALADDRSGRSFEPLAAGGKMRAEAGRTDDADHFGARARYLHFCNPVCQAEVLRVLECSRLLEPRNLL